jgi:predicted nucleotidyltransferase
MISKSQIDSVVQAIVENYKPEKVILFGSYATDTAREDSDLDLAIIKRTSKPYFKRGGDVRMAIRKSGQIHFFAKDILVFTPDEVDNQKDDHYSIVYEILTTGKTLYDRSKSTRLDNKS